MASHYTPLHAQAAEIVAARVGVSPSDLKVEAPPRLELGDVSVACHRLGKDAARAAAEIAQAFRPQGLLASATATGPFVNFKADRPATLRWLLDASSARTLVPTSVGSGQTVCIDYSSPNVSKHLAFHHIRSTMIGHALVQIFRALGYSVVGINHLGDWGTTHGMLIAAYRRWGAPEPLDVEKLNQLYVQFRDAEKSDPTLRSQARAAFKELEDGDPETRALWQRFREISLAEYQAIYDRLGVVFDEVRGESAYEAELPRVMAELEARKLVVVSQGARVVELDGEKTPILLVTEDGTTLYATRDVAAAEYRWNTYHPTRSLYVVDRGQSLHFRQLFKLLVKMGYDWARVCEHVPFGLVKFGGVKTATRAGNVILLKDVLDQAAGDVRALIAEQNPKLAGAILDEVAQMVGTGAVVFANLASQREKDVEFAWEKVINLHGDSGPYIQYSHARCASILRNAPADDGGEVETALLTHDAEWAVARKLADFPDTIVRAAQACEPHVVCHYLLDLAGVFSRWYTLGSGDRSLRVLTDDAPTRRARLALVGAVKAVLARGLAMLGMAAPDQM
jgi:arginyl-tRNA synthetase